MVSGLRTDQDTVYEKSPTEVRKVPFEFSGDLGTSETISTVASTDVVDVSETPDSPNPTLTVDGTSISGTKVQVQLSSGTARHLYVVEVKTNTSGSQVIVSRGRVWVDTP